MQLTARPPLTRLRRLAALALPVALLVLVPGVRGADAQSVTVDSDDDFFEPKIVEIRQGNTVRWINVGRAIHTVTAADRSWDSGDLRSGEEYSRTFDTLGDHPYYCVYHGSGSGSGMAGTVTVTADDGPPALRQSGRLAGANRFATAVEIAKHAFPDGAPVVYLARADDYPDALAGGSLTDGPVLLVPRCGEVPQVVLDEIRRLNPQRVTALGGNGSVCDEVLAQAAAA